MHLTTGRPFAGAMLDGLKDFLKSCGLDYDASVSFSAAIMEDDEIIATGSLDGMTLKCIAVSPKHQGEDLTGQIMTCLMEEASRQGKRHLMLYTKPGNQHLFRAFGFHPVIRTSDCLMMENRRGGLANFLNGLDQIEGKPVGCIVANCNPFTLGHRYLIENAAAKCGCLHVFILSESKGMFSPAERLEMARLGCADLPNVLVHESGPYMVSSATFPSYFIKDKARVEDVHCELDLTLFCEKIAPALGIQHRFVGTEPNCLVTRHYNEQMKRILPEHGISVHEIPRKESGGEAVSASRVRALMDEDRFDALNALLPASSLTYLKDRRR